MTDARWAVADDAEAGETVATLPPAAEWDRVELLAAFQVDALTGRDPDDESLARLGSLERQVRMQRAAHGSWTSALADGRDLTLVEINVLAAVLAPLMREQVAWLYRQLEPAATGRGVPVRLIQRIMPLGAEEVRELREAASAHGRLASGRLITVSGLGQGARLRPGPGLAERLPVIPAEPDPPGMVRATRTPAFDDLVLPEETLAQLHELVARVRHRWLVEAWWGGEATGGPIALFTGPSGVGKTLSALAVGRELGWPVYTLEMGRIASRWVGLAERRLDRLLDCAHGRPIVLVLNEGEAFLSKRGEIKEARDRYANLFVSFLLDRIERHSGPFIVTSNLRDNIDSAFIRRFHSVIAFTKPSAGARAELWRRLLPPGAPRDGSIGFDAIGEAVVLTGGEIRNAALHAAYLAAEAHRPVTIGHIARGVRRELDKRGRRATRRELGLLAEHCDWEDEA